MKPQTSRKFNIFNIILTTLMILSMMAVSPATGAKAAVPQAEADAPQSQQADLAGMLNPDGSLDLQEDFQGSFDLADWNVSLDPQHGPLFSPAGNLQAAAPAAGNWGDLGSGGSAINGFVNSTGRVSAIAVDGTDVYFGGDFINAGGIPEADFIARWDSSGNTWHALGHNGSGNGALPFGSKVTTISVSDTVIYVGGFFQNINNKGTSIPEGDHIAKYDTNSGDWSALGSNGSGNGALNSDVNTIAIDGTKVYAGGSFTNAANTATADYIAVWDTTSTTWANLGDDNAGDGSLNAWVNTIAVDGSGNVYAGGGFTDVNNSGSVLAKADYIAKWDGSNWSNLGANSTDDDGALTNWVGAIAIDGTDIYVGGNFTDAAGNAAADRIAMWNGSAWSALGNNGAGNGSLNSSVYTLIIIGGNVYAGGGFSNVNNGGSYVMEADRIAVWDGSDWSAVGNDGGTDGAIKGPVQAIGAVGSDIYVGGDFTYIVTDGVNPTPAGQHVAKFSTSWSTVGGPYSTVNNQVYALAVDGTNVYVGGRFHNAGGDNAADFVAKWDGSDWSSLGSNMWGDGSIGGSGPTIYDIVVHKSDVYVAGWFYYLSNSDGSAVDSPFLARWDSLTDTWHAVGDDGTGGGPFNHNIYALAVSGNKLYAGGYFTNLVNKGVAIPEADYVAMYDMDTGDWSALGDNGAGDGALNWSVYALATNGSDLYVGGDFNNAAGIQAADKIAKWDGSAWSSLGDNGYGGGVLFGAVWAITSIDQNIFVGGDFTNATGMPEADYIARWDGSAWFALGSNGAGDGALNAPVYDILPYGNYVIVVGEFTNASGITEADLVAKWGKPGWTALGSDGAGDGSFTTGSNLSADGVAVQALAMDNDAVYVGGEFLGVNNNGSVLDYGNYVAAYGLANVAPEVISITRDGPSPTSAVSVDFTVTFTEPVTGVGTDDFSLTTTGSITGTAVTGVHPASGPSSIYTVTASTGKWNGSMYLNVIDDDSIVDTASSPAPLGGVSAGNGNYYGNDAVYSVEKIYTLSVKSQAKYDGWVLESSEFSKIGGTKNNLGKVLQVGDDAQDKQYRAILSFGTAGIPDGASIKKAILKVKKAGVVGKNPMTTHKGLVIDIRKGKFYTLPALQINDFQAKPNMLKAGKIPNKLFSGWYKAVLYTGAYDYINQTGRTQLRLRFTLDDNDDNGMDILEFYSGNSILANRPKLIVKYQVP